MRRNHSKTYKRNRKREEQFGTSYFCDPIHPEIWAKVDHFRRTIYYNTAAAPDATKVQRIGCRHEPEH